MLRTRKCDRSAHTARQSAAGAGRRAASARRRAAGARRSAASSLAARGSAATAASAEVAEGGRRVSGPPELANDLATCLRKFYLLVPQRQSVGVRPN